MARRWEELPADRSLINTAKQTARDDGADLSKLMHFLTHLRPAKSDEEQKIAAEVFASLPNPEHDDYGNFWCVVGDQPPTVMYSCHTDTVAKKGGRQNIVWDGDYLRLQMQKPGTSLGADDGAGMWLLTEMIKAGAPGLYIFHREEEIGGKGSDYLTRENPKLVDGITKAIAFDRRATHSIITHQFAGRCCSDTFAKAFAAALNGAEKGFKFETDDTGSFTDTANYIDLVGECTNVSVGYYNEHGASEFLDVAHLLRLRRAMLKIDVPALPVERQPGEFDADDYYGYYGGGYYTPKPKDKVEELADLIERRSYSVALWLHNNDWDIDQLKEVIDEALFDEEKEFVAKDEAHDEPAVLVCEDCNNITNELDLDTPPRDHMECPWCASTCTFTAFADEVKLAA